MLVPEEVVILPLMSDTRFARFYEVERKKVGAIGWEVGVPQKPGKDARFYAARDAAGRTLGARITLAGRPAVGAADLVAHEILHLVLLTEGFPYIVTTDPALLEMACSLANPPHDLLICDRLRVYGWDVRPDPADAGYHRLAERWGYATKAQMRRLLEHLVEASFLSGRVEVL